MRRTHTSERGAVLVHVALGLVALLGFSALSIDYGVMWASRAQAQNAADAAALAGAVSLAYHDRDDLPRAREAAAAAGRANAVWGEPPDIDPDTDVVIGPCPPGITASLDLCVKATVYRNQDRGNALPTFFARVIGVDDQGVIATATARVLVGNVVDCVRPWAIPDKWFDNVDNDPPIDSQWTWDDRFERYYENGPNAGQLLSGPVDVYQPPSSDDPGSGFRAPQDIGTEVALSRGNGSSALEPGWFFPVRLPLPGGESSGAADYEENIVNCRSLPLSPGDKLNTENGAMVGPTSDGVEQLIAKDPNAYWDTNTNSIQGSCCAKSPRLVPILIFDVDQYYQQNRLSGMFEIEISNILGFFVKEMGPGNTVIGVFSPYPARFDQGDSTLTEDASFLYTVVLVR